MNAHPRAGRRPADDLLHYLQQARDTLVSAMDGLSEYDVRRPVMPSGTNLLGLVKHLAGIEVVYLGDSVGRPSPVSLPWIDDGSIWDSADMWASAEQSRAEIVELYRTVWRHSDESVTTLDWASPAHVTWWEESRRDTTFGHLLVRVVAETAQHAGQADIIRELVDGRGGRDHDDVGDAAWWAAYVQRIQEAADAHR